MAITWADVTVIAPELAPVAAPTQAVILADAYAQLSEDAWGDNIDLGAKYLAAHLATLTTRGGSMPAGALISETEGPASKSYAAGFSSPTALDSTAYGRHFTHLLATVAYRGGVPQVL